MAMAVSSQQSRDAALLRATTELFVLDQTHDQVEIRRFEELTAHFLTKVTPADRAFVAERLARHPDTPGAILRMLGKDLAEIASPVLRHAELSSFDLLAIMAATGPTHYRMIAARDDLSPDVVQALRLTGDAETIALLPAEADDAPPAHVVPPAPAAKPLAATIPAGATEASAPLPEAPAAAVPTQPDVIATTDTTANHPVTEKPADALSALAAARVLTASLSAEMTALATEVPVPEGLSRRTFESLSLGTRPVVEPKAAPATGEAPAPRPAPAKPAEPVAAEPIAEPRAIDVPAAAPAPKTAEPVVTKAEKPAEAPSPRSAEAFLRLDRDARLALLASISASPIVPPRLSPAEIDNAFRAAMSRARLGMLARQRQRDALINTLADGLRLDVARVTALLDDPSGEALVVLLKAIGLADAEAQQVLLLANPVISAAIETFARLTGLLGGIEEPAATRLVAQWRNDGAAESRPAHQPHFADVARKDARHVAAERATDHAKPALTGTTG
ncbi:hypothetical protein [Kaistia granuli]|uniref:hypothetical protein n=1 Tax=Kaistia granuli TaxID=363259 RepID=UPI00036D0665|nr:hypothetical protein [Kaistia granuli]